MPTVPQSFVPGDQPAALADQTDARIRQVEVSNSGGALPSETDLLAALRVALTPLKATKPATPTSDDEFFAQGLLASQQMVAEVTRLGELPLVVMSGAMKAAVDSPAYAALTLDQVQANLETRLGPLLRQVVDAWYGTHNRPAQDVVDVVADWASYEGADGLGVRYLARHPQQPEFTGNLSPAEVKQLATFLKKLAQVATALKSATEASWQPGIKAGWSTAPVIEVAVGGDTEEDFLIPEKAIGAQLRKNIEQALRAIGTVAHQAATSLPVAPKFLVTKQEARDTNLRASNEGGTVNITIGTQSSAATVAHEIGHVLENFLPLGCWLDLTRLLHARHAGGPLVAIYPGHKDPEVRKEVAYNATMPAYGHLNKSSALYPARAYGGTCPTELMSTTLELLTDSSGTNALLSHDPQVAAIVLRWTLGTQRMLTLSMPADLVKKVFPSPLT